MELQLVVLVVLALGSVAAAQCSSYARCSDCISQTSDCGWCLTAGIAGCMAVSNASLCPGVGQFLNPQSAILSESTNSTLITPQFVSAFTRLGIPLKVRVTVTPGPIPLDILFVEDLSGSMADDVVTLRAIAPTIVAQVRQQAQNDTFFGITGFIDKSDHPSAYYDSCARFTSTSNRNCGNYDGASWLTLSADYNAFYNALNTLPNTGNADWPESLSEGVMKGALCPGVGWRSNSRKMMLISTDADLHIAGDGLMAGITEPRQMACQASELSDDFLPGLMYDYPSLSMLRAVFLKENIVPILMIQTNAAPYYNNLALYQKIVDFWGFGYMYQLTANSDNIVAGIISSYNTVAQTITIIPAQDPLSWVTSIVPAAGYTGAVLGATYPFDLFITANVPNTVQILRLTAFGFGDVIINASSIYVCACAAVPCPVANNSLQCGGAGACECGKCICSSANFTGIDCGCDVNKPCNPPCLNGKCVCGACECNAGWQGPSCNCSSLPCPGNGNCNGNGACECGQCKCNAGFLGIDCFCSTGNCPATAAGNCSNQGICNCGSCSCFAGWTGPFCNCSSQPCPGLCSGHGTCNCGTCDCDPGWKNDACDCKESSCPVNPTTGLECSGAGICLCGECQCPLATGPSCNCSTLPCPSANSFECSGHGTCACGSCKCTPPFDGPDCACDSSATCPSASPPQVCSGHGTCQCGVCNCLGGYISLNGTGDCSCFNVPCPGDNTCSGHGTCVCGECQCTPPFTGPTCSCDSSFTCPLNCSGHGTCDVCGDKTCKCDSGSIAAPPPPLANFAGVVPVSPRAVGDSFGYSGPGCECSNAPCEGGCGSTDGSTGTCVCGVCQCKNGWEPPNCVCNPSRCNAPGGCVHGACDPCGNCICTPGWTGVDCTVCDATVRSCVEPCQGRTCGSCLADSQCGWCEQTGNCSIATNTAACPAAFKSSCKKAAEAIYNTASFRAGAYSLGALLALFLLAVILYKIWIWRRDRELWRAFNAQKDWGVSDSPLYQDAFQEAQNPLYDAQFHEDPAAKGGAAPAFF